jgi:hypothetical protein
MKRLLFTLISGCSLFLLACPLQTQSPITSGKAVAAPEGVFGTWAEVENDTVTSAQYIVAPNPEGPAKLLIYDVDTKGERMDETVREAVLSSVAGHHFASIYDKGGASDGPGYYHFAIGQSKTGDMQLVPLTEYIVEGDASGDDLAAYLTEHADEEHHLDREDIYRFRKVK